MMVISWLKWDINVYMDNVYLPEKRVKARETRQVRPGRFGLMSEPVI